MSLTLEYLKILQAQGSPALEAELQRLIAEYNKLRGKYLFVFSTAIGKPIPMLSLDQSDYYMFHDLLRNKPGIKEVEVYIETPGGSGEAAEEIALFLHKNFETVSFLVSGEAKSAGTILVLSGHEILMTETGSLGPIDAQMQIGRSTISAYDYTDWVDTKRKEAAKAKRLNPFDATMVAQITPGELAGVANALHFAGDLVTKWLINYKYKSWIETETRKIKVTAAMKRKAAKKVVADLINHSKWRSHGRSIKIDDLEKIGLKIIRVNKNPDLADIVLRIQMVCRIIFDSTTAYKIFATADEKIFKQATPVGGPLHIQLPFSPMPAGGPFPLPQTPRPDVVQIQQQCPKCGKFHNLYGKLSPNPNIDQDFKNRGFLPFPKDAKLKCDNCGFEIDLLGIKNKIEMDMQRKMID